MYLENFSNNSTLSIHPNNLLFQEASERLGLSSILDENTYHKRCGFQNSDILLSQLKVAISGISTRQALPQCNISQNRADIDIQEFYKCQKTTVYEALSCPYTDYNNILLQTAIKSAPSLFSPKEQLFLALDDSLVERAYNRHCEGSTYVFDHNKHTTTRGYFDLLLILTNGKTAIPVAHVLCTTSDKEHLVDPSKTVPCKDAPKGSYGETIRNRLTMTKIQAGLEMIRSTLPEIEKSLNRQIDYILTDSWFTSSNNFCEGCKEMGLSPLGMFKINQTLYQLKDGRIANIQELTNEAKNLHHCAKKGGILYKLKCKRAYTEEKFNGSKRKAAAKYSYENNPNDEVYLFFMANYSKSSKNRPVVVLMSSDCSLQPEQAIANYKYRWKIEELFKTIKGGNSSSMSIYNCQATKLNHINASISLHYVCYILASVIAFILNSPPEAALCMLALDIKNKFSLAKVLQIINDLSQQHTDVAKFVLELIARLYELHQPPNYSQVMTAITQDKAHI